MGRRALLIGLVVTMIVAVSGCNLPHGQVGTKCSPVGKGAQDGTYVLTCNKKHRFQRVMTIAAADALYAAYLRAHAPTTTSPPPPITTLPPPPAPTWGAGTYIVGAGSAVGHIPAGTYVATDPTTLENCSWRRSDSSATELGSDVFDGLDFMQVQPSDLTVQLSGLCTWTAAPSTPFS